MIHRFLLLLQTQLSVIAQYTVILLERSAIIPQILQNKQELTLVRWLPALFDSTVNDIYHQLCDACPTDLVIYKGKKIFPQEQIKTVISWIISGLIYDNLPTTLTSKRLSNIVQLFFYGQKLYFKTFMDQEIPNSIHQWLSKLYLAERTHKLYLKIEETKGDFKIIPQILLKNTTLPISVKEALKIDKVETRIEILSDLSLIADYLPEFDAMIQDVSGTCFSLNDFVPLFLHILPALQAIGVVVVLPKSLHKILKPKINLALKSKSNLKDDRPSFLSLQNLVEFNWQIAIGDQTLSIEEFKKILKQSGTLVKIMDNYILLNEKEMAELLKQIEKLPNHLPQEDLLQAMLAEELDSATVSLDRHLKKLIQSFNKYEPSPVPYNLQAYLRPYQEHRFQSLS